MKLLRFLEPFQWTTPIYLNNFPLILFRISPWLNFLSAALLVWFLDKLSSTPAETTNCSVRFVLWIGSVYWSILLFEKQLSILCPASYFSSISRGTLYFFLSSILVWPNSGVFSQLASFSSRIRKSQASFSTTRANMSAKLRFQQLDSLWYLRFQ